MGQVYQATDTKLNRQVALKILPEAFASDPDRLARFQREAQVLASLNHPNIAAIHGLEESEGTKALVLELVAGPTLADRIKQGPIPIDEALPIAKQIAEALEAAHEAGVIHRDLKPANIKVKDDGTVKVLDFGLAKALDTAPESDPSQSPTLTAAATQMGVIMGTAAYMSPEQARGKTVDRRADIWSFGAVLFEMLSGRRPFEGRDVSEVLAAVIQSAPDWDTLPGDTPPHLNILVRRCLEKEPRQRMQAVGDVRLAIEGGFGTADLTLSAKSAFAQLSVWQRPVPALLAAVLLVALGGMAARSLTGPVPGQVTRTSIVLPQTQQRTGIGARGVAVSPTGTNVVYVANDQLYLRALDELAAEPLAGSQGSRPSTPFFSADGESVGFYSGQDNTLKKVALSGGAAVTLAQTGIVFGASWGLDNTIVFGERGRGVLQVSGQGGTPDLLVSVQSPALAHRPQMLPGDEAVLYTLSPGQGQWDAAQIVVEQVATGERIVVVEGGSDARYLPTGHLVYAVGGTLLAAPFDLDRLEVTGGAVPLVEGVNRATQTGAVDADIARTGTLVYLPSGSSGGSARTLVWVDRSGTEETLAAPPRGYVYPRVSPDGTRVALEVREEENDIWVWDLRRESITRLTFAAGDDQYPVWTPDSRRVVFRSSRDGTVNIYWRAADGTGTVERLTSSPNRQSPHTFSPDGAHLVFREDSPNTGIDLQVLTLDDARRVEPLIVTGFNDFNAEVLPDGRWLAYQSDASGQNEIYVQPFPDVDAGRWQISTTGGSRPLWGPNGRELFYLASAGVMAVMIETGTGFEAGPPMLVVEGAYLGTSGEGGSGRTYDIAPNGERFLMIKQGASANREGPFAGLTQIHVVQNWHQELLERVPVN